MDGTAAIAAPGKGLIMRHPLVRAVALVLLVAVAAPPFALAAGDRLPQASPVFPAVAGEIWSLLRSVFGLSGHGIDPNGLQSSDPDLGHGIEPDGLRVQDYRITATGSDAL